MDLGWRTAWLVEGIAIWLIVIPIALLAMRNTPADLGQHPDGPVRPGDDAPPPVANVGLTRAQTLRRPYFWLISSAIAMSGLLTTAVSFHQISLLTARGLTPAQAAANFVPQTIAGLVASLVTGYLMDRFAGRWMIVGSMLVLSAGLFYGTQVTPGISAFAFGAMLGAAGSMICAVEAAALPRYFGLRHIGSIRGIVASIGVGGSACGPLLFAAAYDQTHTYDAVLTVCAFLPLALVVWALVAREPRPATGPTVAAPDPAVDLSLSSR